MDRKLLWKDHVEERRRKAYNALYICKKFMSSTWGLSPSISYWLYSAVVRPILTYGCLVWWKAVRKKHIKDTLTTVQRAALLAITGAVRFTPTEALETMLNITPIDIFIEGIATKTALRLSSIEKFKETNFGHSTILNQREFFNFKNLDNTTPKLSFNCNFTTLFPSREEWIEGEVTRNDDISIYTDGSKMESGTGSGVFSEEISLAESTRLLDGNTVFQAEIFAVLTAARKTLEKNISHKRISIYVDSQAAIKALISIEIRSKIVWECKEALNKLGINNTLKVCWIPGHSNHIGNETADELARKGSALPIEDITDEVKPSISEGKAKVDRNMKILVNKRWMELNKCETTKLFWPETNPSRSRKLLSHSRKALRTLLAIQTGQNFLRKQAKRMGLINHDDCRYCGGIEYSDNAVHFITSCDAISRTRYNIIGKICSEETLNEISDGKLIRLFRKIDCCPFTVK